MTAHLVSSVEFISPPLATMLRTVAVMIRSAREMQMCLHSQTLVCLLSIAMSIAAQAQTSPEQATEEMADVVAEETAGSPVIDAEALDVFKAMSDHLVAAREFAFETETSHDVVQRSGIKVEFSASRRTLVSRPNRMRLESRQRRTY